jgi:hypothetical protein
MNLEGSRCFFRKLWGIWSNGFQNLEQNEGSKCKIEGQGVDL